MPDSPWIWFEREARSPVKPSLVFTFDSPHERVTYSLQSIVYAGGNHFTIRFRGRSGGWWKQDGQIDSGAPQVDSVQSDEDLLVNDRRFACIFIYRRDDH